MMHNASFVVTVKSLRDRKAIREFNHSRVGRQSQTTVLLPFDSEYQFTFKVLDDARRRVNITIDGTTVADDLVLSPGESSLERFLDNDRRFKFARLSHSGVADPSNTENGRVEIKVWKEKPAPQVFHIMPPRPQAYRTKGGGGGPLRGADMRLGAPGFTTDSIAGASSESYGSVTSDLLASSRGADLCDGDSLGFASTVSCSADAAIMPQSFSRSRGIAPLGEAGATVEGSKSYQSFGSTTWRGDECSEPDVFVIYLRGKESTPEAPWVPSSKFILCGVCQTQTPLGSKFCCNCGGRF